MIVCCWHADYNYFYIFILDSSISLCSFIILFFFFFGGFHRIFYIDTISLANKDSFAFPFQSGLHLFPSYLKLLAKTFSQFKVEDK